MDKKLVKSVGEHWVCSELARRGWATALTRDGLARTDILAVSTELPGRPMIEVQVKSATQVNVDAAVSWMTGKAATQFDESDREWFVLVAIPPEKHELTAYVIPRDHLAAAVCLSHQDWLTDPSATRARTSPLSMARIHAHWVQEYRRRWDLLERPTSVCPDLLPAELTGLIDDPRVGLPDGHPWLAGKPRT